MSTSVAQLYDRYYFGRPEFINGTAEFHQLCRQEIRPGSNILEVGPGPSNRTTECLSKIGPVTGLDVSSEVMENRYLHSARVYDGKLMPWGDREFDACVSDFVLEHISDPATHFAEVARVLKPGGLYCLRTPNLWHYVAMASRLAPHSLHLKSANRLRGMGPGAHDPYPTTYEANTARRIRRYARSSGFEIRHLRLIEKEPSYGRASQILFYPMMMYERIVNRFSFLRCFRCNILAVLEKHV